ncbi:uncharacterized protein F5891DRAFT_1203158 [Suillus fuscotomentosus]|uniref:Uncharacterized protein n=1 Tax=Suillus fuscotomentosus TaxID=1912939 RepID=A0AAD4DMR4_9AGAM|nr:uncharacterized protein F5891DRAFT_1203158 [Suillus fuscotomentosus]KAG1883881.1 hypothetical protein F5891DRAFT_1203158 [Suillus fuscotomentosus]
MQERSAISEIVRDLFMDVARNQLVLSCGYKDWNEWDERMGATVQRSQSEDPDVAIWKAMENEASSKIQRHDSGNISEAWKIVAKQRWTLLHLIKHANTYPRSNIVTHSPTQDAILQAIGDEFGTC